MKRPRLVAWVRPLAIGALAGGVGVVATLWLRPAAPPPPAAISLPAEAPPSLESLLYPVASTEPITPAEAVRRLGTTPARVPATGPVRVVRSPPPPAFAAGAGPTLRAKLDRPIDHFAVKDLPADAALQRWAELAGVNLSVNWPPLQRYGLDPALPLTLELRGVPAGQVLELLIDRLGGQMGRLATVFADGDVLSVEVYGAAGSVGRSRLVTRAYNLRRLILDAAKWDVRVAGIAPSRGREEETAGALAQALQSGVAPESWEDNGGTAGKTRYWSGWLLVRNTPEVQEEVAAWLDALSRGGEPMAAAPEN